VSNLLSNAFKFTFEGEVAISLKLVNGAVELQVRDTGEGIPIREHIGVRHHHALRMPDLPATQDQTRPYAQPDERGLITGSFGSPPPAIGGRPAEPREWGVRLAVRLATKQP